MTRIYALIAACAVMTPFAITMVLKAAEIVA